MVPTLASAARTLLLVLLSVPLASSRDCSRPDLDSDSLAGCTALLLDCTERPSEQAARPPPADCVLGAAALRSLLGEKLKAVGGGLKRLGLRGQLLGSSEAVELLASTLGALTALESLDLADTRLGDKGVAPLLAALPASLSSLDLAHNRLTDEGAKAVAAALGGGGSKLSSSLRLSELSLAWNGVGPRGARALGAALGAADCPLASLDLEWNGLLDRGARELGEALKTNDKLQRLRLGYNGIKDAGAEGLAAGLRRNAALAHLDLSNNGVGSDAERRWRAALAATPPPADRSAGGAAREPARREPARRVEPQSADEGDEVEEISFDED